MGQVRVSRRRSAEIWRAASISRSLASAPLLLPPCPSPPSKLGPPSGRRPRPRFGKGPASEGSSYSEGSTWLGFYECSNARIHQCIRCALPGAWVQELFGRYPRVPPQTQGKQGAVGNLHPINSGRMSSLYPRNGEQGPIEIPWLLGEVFFLSHLPLHPGRVTPAFPTRRRGKGGLGSCCLKVGEPPHNPSPSSP